MRNRDILGPWVRRFLLEHLVADRNLSRNTQVSYRDTLTLFLPFVGKRTAMAIDRLSVTDITPDYVRAFLTHLEVERHCGIITRNQRLAAIRSLAYFIGARAPEHLAWCTEVRAVPFKKAAKRVIDYLDKPEMEALVQTPDQNTVLGRRDHALLLLMYNSGARADEVAGLCLGNLQLGTSPCVQILGKGNKWRVCPLWPITAEALQPLVRGRDESERVFHGGAGRQFTPPGGTTEIGLGSPPRGGASRGPTLPFGSSFALRAHAFTTASAASLSLGTQRTWKATSRSPLRHVLATSSRRGAPAESGKSTP